MYQCIKFFIYQLYLKQKKITFPEKNINQPPYKNYFNSQSNLEL